jgi:predicted nucleic acid-binding protein
MRFWDSSALLPLIVEESKTADVRALLQSDPNQSVWCLTEVEVASALARRSRDTLEASEAEAAWSELGFLSARWGMVAAVDQVRARAVRLVRTHPLRAADALQLGAALVACDEQPEALPFVCLDDRLRDAARREGFPVLP